MQALSIARIGSDKRGTARIWLEGRRLERAGFVPAARYEISLDETTRTITLSLAANGERMVSRKVRGDTELPVIAIANGTLLERLDVRASVTIRLEKERKTAGEGK